jgi:hypothetical protein
MALILIIEDNEKNRNQRDLLQVKGYRTVEAKRANTG